MLQQLIGRSLVLVLLSPALSVAESSFSTPAGAASSSSGFSTPAGAANNGPFISSSSFSDPAGAASNALVRGEVVKVDSDSYLVRDADGRELRVQPTKDARIDYRPRTGDWIDVQLNNGRASSITRGSPATIGPGTSETSLPGGGSGMGGGALGGK